MTDISIGIQHFVQIVVDNLVFMCFKFLDCKEKHILRFLEIKRELRLSGVLRSHENETQ